MQGLGVESELAGVSPDSLQVVMEAGSPEALKGLVATGLGFAIMSRATVVLEMRLGQLVQIPLSPRLKRHFSAVYIRRSGTSQSW